MSNGNPFLALRLPHEQHDRLFAEAARSGLTVSDVVRHALAEHLAGPRQPPQQPDAQPRRHAAAQKGLRRASRPVRLQRAINEIEDLLADYENWQANQPEALQDTATAVALADAIDNLQQAVDLLNAIIPPRGFGRD